MTLDLFFRAADRATYINWLTRAQVRAIIGDLRARDEDGSVSSPAALIGIPGAVDLVQWDVNQIVEVPGVYDNDGNVITPPVMDPQAWIQVRLTGPAEAADFAGPPMDTEVEFDRWEHSLMVTLISAGTGTPGLYRGVALFVRQLSGKDLAVFRGSEVETMMKFHEFMGGNSY